MFNDWKIEKAKVALVEEAQALAEKLATAKPHFVESHAAAARLWAGIYLAEGQDLHDLANWKPAAVRRFTTTAQNKIAALRKAREYDSSDGLAIWLHTARAVTEPRVAPPVCDIWQHLLNAGQNSDGLAEDMLQEAGLPLDAGRRAPKGFEAED